MPLQPGLYEQIVTRALDRALADLGAGNSRRAIRQPLRDAEAADRLALHFSRALERAIAALPDGQQRTGGGALVGILVEQLARHADSVSADEWTPNATVELLEAVVELAPDGRSVPISRPHTPLLDTALLTNAPDEPGMNSQIISEIGSAVAIDVIMAFVRLTGVRPLLPAIQAFSARGGRLRVLTTTYTGSTEAAALDLLQDHGAEVRVSYDTSNTRLHAKAWLFHRHAGASTAFVGSSNLTHQAQVTGLEWNLRVSGLRNPAVLARIASVFDSYWEGGDFEPFDHDTFAAATAATGQPGATHISPIQVSARPFQKVLLEQLRFSRARGHARNLLVAATGTGKTVMAALDYRSMVGAGGLPTLLFVAHRREILQQSLATFRQVLQQPDFGELWVDGATPDEWRHVFASIQTLSTRALANLDPAHFRIVIVDEFHHAAATSYERLLNHVEADQLLGLTATPERADGQSILGWFDGRIAAELRLWDAINQHHLVPFHYYGINDEVDLREVPWQRGRGYDAAALTNVYTSTDAWARTVLNQFGAHVADVHRARALGFCVSREHAAYMARFFARHGVAAVAIDGTTTADDRGAALRQLREGRVSVLFSVDLFNEGVDLPNVDTLLLLRPTESATLFMQQLGRGLRREPDKALCTVLDFVGQHRREFRFDLRLRALLGTTRTGAIRQVEQDFPLLPAGCHMHLDRVARARVLDSLRQAVPSNWPRLRSETRMLLAQGMAPTLAAVIKETGLDLEELYANDHSWSELQDALELPTATSGPEERRLRRALGRLLHVDDAVRIDQWLAFVSSTHPPTVAALDARMQRLLRMLVVSLTAGMPSATLPAAASLQDATNLIWSHPQVLAELGELLPLLRERTTHLVDGLARRPENPLQLHARYTRNEILAAFAAGQHARVPAWREGTRWLPDERADVFVFTLDKTDGQFSPTTRYNDYALSERLLHWESQSTTTSASRTGQRYVNHYRQGTEVMLFARLRQADRAFWFLGPGRYVRHTGDAPMQIVWALDTPLPADLYTRFRAVAD